MRFGGKMLTNNVDKARHLLKINTLPWILSPAVVSSTNVTAVLKFEGGAKFLQLLVGELNFSCFSSICSLNMFFIVLEIMNDSKLCETDINLVKSEVGLFFRKCGSRFREYAYTHLLLYIIFVTLIYVNF